MSGKRWKQGLLSSVLLSVLTIQPVLAYAPIQPVDTFKVDDKEPTYYNIKYTGDMKDQQSFLKKAIEAEDLNGVWEGAAMVAFYNNFHSFALDEGIGAYMYQMTGANRDLLATDHVRTEWSDSDLQYASNGSVAYADMRAYIYDLYQNGAGKSTGIDAVVAADISGLSSGTTPTLWQTFGYTNVECNDGKDWEGHYIQLAVFYDNFRLTPVIPADYGKGQTEVTPISGDTKRVSGGYTNSTRTAIQASQSLGSETTETVSNTVEGTQSYSFSESFSLSTQVSVSGLFASGSVSTTFGIGAEQAFSSGWSDSVEKSKVTNSSSSVTIDMPAQTKVALQQTSGGNIFKNSYDCPVAISYDVKVAALVLDPKKASASPQGKMLATFDNSTGSAADAREDYVQRRLSSFYDKDKIDWKASNGSLYNYWFDLGRHAVYTSYYNDIEGKLKNRVPVSITGGVMSYEMNGYTSDIADIIPLYPLAAVAISDGIYDCEMMTGDQKNLSHLSLEGKNTENAGYYGFDQKKGYWILVDENGDQADNTVGQITQDPLNGQSEVTAMGAGTVYAKYMIEEDVYNSAQDESAYTGNGDIETTYLKITVKNAPEEPFAGTVTNSGNATFYIGGEPLALDQELTGTVYDATGIEIPNAAIKWQLREANGAEVSNNEFTATEPGIYHVRASYRDMWSEQWSEIEVRNKKQLDTLVLEDNYDPAVLSSQVWNGMNLVDLNRLSISGLDQYGEAYTDLTVVDLKCVQTDGISLYEGVATITEPGTYEFYAECNGITSNKLSVTVEQSWAVSFQTLDPAVGILQVSSDHDLISGEKVPDQTLIHIQAVPAAGYEVVEVRVNDTPTANNSDVSVRENTTITAMFQKKIETPKSGWMLERGKKYYYVQGQKATGWKKITGKWYFFDQQGSMQTGWKKLSGKWYYLSKDLSDGSMKYGWQKIGEKWYYLSGSGNDGSMKYGWQKIGGKWYYLSASVKDGSMKSGWQRIKGYWYYLGGKEDGAMKTGWQKVGGQWYYLYPALPDKAPEGHMAEREWIGIYYVNASGAWTRTKNH